MTTEVSKWDQQEMVRTLKETVCKGASDSQFRMFVEICKATGLNPLLKEIWFVPNVGIIAARDGYLRVANENPQFDGMETRVERDERNIPIKATCTVWRKDRNHPIICEAYFSEYKKSSGVWNTYPSAMISKVAEVLALKRSFSINGVVSEEEMGEAAALPRQRETSAPETKAIEAPKDFSNEPGYTKSFMQKAPPERAEPPVDPGVPPALREIYKTLAGSDKFAKLDVFKELKQSLKELLGDEGELKYYEILGRQGVQKSNEFKSSMKAQRAARDMYMAIQAAIAPADRFHASDDDLPEILTQGTLIEKEVGYGVD